MWQGTCPGPHSRHLFSVHYRRSVAKLVAELMVSTSQGENRVPLREEGGRKSFQCLRQHFHLYSPIICALGYTDSSAHWTFHQHIQGYGETPERSPRVEGPPKHLCPEAPSGRDWKTLGLNQPPFPPSLLAFLSCLSYGVVKRALDFLTIVFIGCRSIVK